MTTSRPRTSMFVWLALGVTLVTPARAAGEQAQAFFQGKQVRFYCMGSPGGGYDTYGRVLARHYAAAEDWNGRSSTWFALRTRPLARSRRATRSLCTTRRWRWPSVSRGWARA